jgi:CheY-like chemotaxis protein
MSDTHVLSERAVEAERVETPKASVLVMEDEPLVVYVINEALDELGCTVDASSNGEEALRMIGENIYDVILLNIEMPWLRGDALYEEIERWKPALSERVAFISGDTEKVETSAFLEGAGRPYLWKPFSIGDLRKMVIRVMQERDGETMPTMAEGGLSVALA